MKKEIIITLVLLLCVVLLAFGLKLASGTDIDEGDAKNFVTEDLRTRFPEADKVEIINQEARVNPTGELYFAMKASVSSGLSTPCPTRTYYYYNYPEQNFALTPPEAVVKNCKVCESGGCILAFEEEAIIASHTLSGTKAVDNAIKADSGLVPKIEIIQGGWIITWANPGAPGGYAVTVGRDGRIAGVEKF